MVKRINEADYRWLMGNGWMKCDHYVECGLLDGDQMDIAKNVFLHCYGVELSEHYARKNEERFRDCPHVAISHGLSVDFLREYPIQEPTFFYLDSHACELPSDRFPVADSEFPLWEELEIVEQRKAGDIVWIDDVHAFGQDRDDWLDVTQENVLKVFGNQATKYMVYRDGFIVWLCDNPPPIEHGKKFYFGGAKR